VFLGFNLIPVLFTPLPRLHRWDGLGDMQLSGSTSSASSYTIRCSASVATTIVIWVMAPPDAVPGAGDPTMLNAGVRFS